MSAAIEAEQINAINIVEPPNLAYRPSSPIVVLNLVLGLFFGVVLGLAYVFFRSRFSSTLYTPEDLSAALARGAGESTPVVQLPDMLFPRAQGFIRRLMPAGRLFRAGATPDDIVRKMPENTLSMMGRKFFYPDNRRRIPRSLLLSGTGNKVGSTTCAKLLAEHLRKTYACRILLVETRFARPKDRSPAPAGRDFASWLRGGAFAEAEEEIAEVEAFPAGTPVGAPEPAAETCAVDVLPAGVLDDAAQSAVFALTREKLDALRDGHDLMIFDAEPIIRSSVSLHIAGLAEDVILVARSEVTRREVLHSTRGSLEEIGGNLTGAICNFRRFYIPDWVYRLIQ